VQGGWRQRFRRGCGRRFASFLGYGCGAPRPLAHELSGFVADRSSQDSSPRKLNPNSRFLTQAWKAGDSENSALSTQPFWKGCIQVRAF